jgi:serine/threonine protein kinase
VVNKKYKKEFAMKQMLKKKIIDKRSEVGILYERDLLSRMTHPFIVNMHFSFQDIHFLYLVMDLITGKDLRYHLSLKKKF